MELPVILEAALLAAARPLTLSEIAELFEEHERPTNEELRTALGELGEICQDRPVELKEVASGFRLQVKEQFSPWVSRLFEERPARYSRALLETLAIIAYRQPATRGEIEDIRGVAVSTGIIRTLLDRGWIHAVGQKEVPGRPNLFATTKHFLDYFNLNSLGQLPPIDALPALLESLDPASISTDEPPEPSEPAEDAESPSQQAIDEPDEPDEPPEA